MEKIWVVVADGVRARLLQAETRTGPLIERDDFAHPESRLPERDLVSDTRGRTAVSGNHDRRHAYGEDYDEQDRQRDVFARELVRYLEKRRKKGELEILYIIAEPGFLGLLRGHISKQLANCVRDEIRHRVTTDKLDAIRKLLPKDMRGLG
jgi:protein required for attachment to host cells